MSRKALKDMHEVIWGVRGHLFQLRFQFHCLTKFLLTSRDSISSFIKLDHVAFVFGWSRADHFIKLTRREKPPNRNRLYLNEMEKNEDLKAAETVHRFCNRYNLWFYRYMIELVDFRKRAHLFSKSFLPIKILVPLQISKTFSLEIVVIYVHYFLYLKFHHS